MLAGTLTSLTLLVPMFDQVGTLKAALAIVFPGQGSQHVHMAREFYESEPRFRSLIDQCAELLQARLGLSLTDVLFPGEDADEEAASEQLKHTVLAQPAIFVIGCRGTLVPALHQGKLAGQGDSWDKWLHRLAADAANVSRSPINVVQH